MAVINYLEQTVLQSQPLSRAKKGLKVEKFVLFIFLCLVFLFSFGSSKPTIFIHSINIDLGKKLFEALKFYKSVDPIMSHNSVMKADRLFHDTFFSEHTNVSATLYIDS